MREYSPKVLLIDDIKENLITLEMNMRILDVEIISVQSGKEALIQVKQHDFAVLIVDVQMPEMNGFQAAERIRQGRRNRHTPIIFLTAVFHDQSSIYQGYRSGAVDYITKPFNREILLSKVRVFLDLDRIKQELSEAKQQFQSIVQDQTDLICRTDKELNILFANRALLVAFAKTFESLKGENILDWAGEDELEKLKNAIKLLTPTNAVVKIHHTLDISRSRQLMVSTIIRALFDSDYELIGYQMVMRDITTEIKTREDLINERKKAEDITSSRSLLVESMSHEILTPINSMLGIIDGIAVTDLDESQTESLVDLRFLANKLLGIFEDILSLSKVSGNRIKFEHKWFALADELNKSIKLIEGKAKQNNHQLKLEIDNDLPHEIKGDASKISEVLMRLLRTVGDFSGNGDIKLKAEKESINKNQVKIKFSVSEASHVLSEKIVKNSFNFFNSNDPDIKNQFGENRLGLAISNSLAEKMGSHVQLKSSEGEGTSFWFSLTLEAKETVEKVDNGGIHILVVEDNMLNQRVVGTTLERNGYTYDLAENGMVAVEKFQNNLYDVVIMDIQMPVMDGYEATQKIRLYEKTKPERKRTWIIALTANATREDREKCKEIGMDDYMTKPFRFKELSEIISKRFQ